MNSLKTFNLSYLFSKPLNNVRSKLMCHCVAALWARWPSIRLVSVVNILYCLDSASPRLKRCACVCHHFLTPLYEGTMCAFAKMCVGQRLCKLLFHRWVALKRKTDGETNTLQLQLEWALGRAHTFAYHKIGHCIMNVLALVACQLDKNWPRYGKKKMLTFPWHWPLTRLIPKSNQTVPR